MEYSTAWRCSIPRRPIRTLCGSTLEHEGRRQTDRRAAYAGSRLKLIDASGRSRLIRQPFSRNGENSPSGMLGGIVETSASFEARFAPRSYPTNPVIVLIEVNTCANESSILSPKPDFGFWKVRLIGQGTNSSESATQTKSFPRDTSWCSGILHHDCFCLRTRCAAEACRVLQGQDHPHAQQFRAGCSAGGAGIEGAARTTRPTGVRAETPSSRQNRPALHHRIIIGIAL